MFKNSNQIELNVPERIVAAGVKITVADTTAAKCGAGRTEG